jgi:hypothetical protein
MTPGELRGGLMAFEKKIKYDHWRRGGPPWSVTQAIGAGKTRPYVELRGCI